MRVPFWVLIIVRHLIFRVPKKGPRLWGFLLGVALVSRQCVYGLPALVCVGLVVLVEHQVILVQFCWNGICGRFQDLGFRL